MNLKNYRSAKSGTYERKGTTSRLLVVSRSKVSFWPDGSLKCKVLVWPIYPEHVRSSANELQGRSSIQNVTFTILFLLLGIKTTFQYAVPIQFSPRKVEAVCIRELSFWYRPQCITIPQCRVRDVHKVIFLRTSPALRMSCIRVLGPFWGKIHNTGLSSKKVVMYFLWCRA
jgi:hypothetical protein